MTLQLPLIPTLLILVALGFTVFKLWPLLTVLRFGLRTGARFPIAWQQPTEDNPTGAVYAPRVMLKMKAEGYRHFAFGDPSPVSPHHVAVLDELRKEMSVPIKLIEFKMGGELVQWFGSMDRNVLIAAMQEHFGRALHYAVMEERYESAARYRDTIANIETLVDNELKKHIKPSTNA
jgi:hypothetical protein